ncbi:MAG: hypothetical protein J1E38_03990 [Paramuribaculum sp.]|nr:hypothetical protein [Paramuribaculum sp.]
MKQIIKLSLILVFLSPLLSFAQNVNTVQPSIMVVPFTKEGEDIREIIEGDVNKRTVLTAIKEAFDSRGFSTYDFIGKYKAISNQAAFNRNNQADITSDIIANSGADIYIVAEIEILKRSDGNSVNIILNAYDTYTGVSLANKTGNSGKFYTDNYSKLADVAIKKNMDTFLNTLQSKFNDIVNNGRSIRIEIGVDDGSDVTLDDDIKNNGDFLSDLIMDWMEKNAYKNYAHSPGGNDKSLIFDDVRIPVFDPQTHKNYNIRTFANSFRKYLSSLGLTVKQNINGSQLYISIQ